MAAKSYIDTVCMQVTAISEHEAWVIAQNMNKQMEGGNYFGSFQAHLAEDQYIVVLYNDACEGRQVIKKAVAAWLIAEG